MTCFVHAAARATDYAAIKNVCNLQDENCMLMTRAPVVTIVVCKSLYEQVLLKLIPAKGCNTVAPTAVAPALLKFIGPFLEWHTVGPSEAEILQSLKHLVVPITPTSHEKHQAALNFFTTASADPHFWLTSLCKMPNFMEMCAMIKADLEKAELPDASRQLARSTKLFQKLEQYEAASHDTYQHGKSLETIEDIASIVKRLSNMFDNTQQDPKVANDFGLVLSSILRFHETNLEQLDSGMSEMLHTLIGSTDCADSFDSQKTVFKQVLQRVCVR